MANELLEFEDGTRGLALNLDIREIGVVVLGDFSQIEEGQQVRRTGEILSVPVGDAFLGRVVDPLGNPLDGNGEIGETELRRSPLGRRAMRDRPTTRLRLRDDPFGAFTHSVPLTGDGLIRAVPIPGHTRGQLAFIID